MARNEAWVSVGHDHDPPAFSVASIRHWWRKMGRRVYPKATTLYIAADAGGSNGYRCGAWKHELQRFGDRAGLTINVRHAPPGTSKWNKIEHRLFWHITANRRGTPLPTYETIVDRIGNTRTAAGLRVRAALDTREYPTGVTVTKSQMDAVPWPATSFSGEWNYKTGTSTKLTNQYRSLSLVASGYRPSRPVPSAGGSGRSGEDAVAEAAVPCRKGVDAQGKEMDLRREAAERAG